MAKPSCDANPAFSAMGVPAHTGPYDLVVVGASFGGPPAVAALLEALPAEFPSPLVVCQHISPGFTASWATRLGEICALSVSEAARGMKVERGHVYVAPSGFQTRVAKDAVGHAFFRVDVDFADSLYIPSVDLLMSSAAQTFGSHTLAVLLTGLGHDGACGMLAIREAGGYTIAESEMTAASYSMPGSAAELGAVVEVLPLGRVISRVLELSGVEDVRTRSSAR